jgi:hypothetical protein
VSDCYLGVHPSHENGDQGTISQTWIVDRQLGGDVCVHLRAYVHRVPGACFGGGHHHRWSWIMTQNSCEEAGRHACQRRCREWWLTGALCFLHQPLHRGPGSHNDRVLAHTPTVDPRSGIRT